MATVHANLAQAQRRAAGTGRERPSSQAEPRPADGLLERAAMVRDLPAEHLGAFRHYIQEQGTAFLANVDEWLEAHCPAAARVAEPSAMRPTRSARGGVTAGVHVFAFVEEAEREPPRTRRGGRVRLKP
jgi:hypothetical protein